MVSDLGTTVSVIPESTVRSSLVGVTMWCQGRPTDPLYPQDVWLGVSAGQSSQGESSSSRLWERST
jgi:hypothetical protein